MASNGIDYDALREKMVIHLVSEGDIKDENVIAAMRQVPRHLFVQENVREQAYEDHALPIGYEQTISQPYIVAKMTELLEVSRDDKIMEIGTGSGYQTAILASIAKHVYTIERIAELASLANSLLKELKYQNVKIKVGDGTCGWREEAPFDGIIITACARSIPEVIIEQLGIGGRLVIPVGNKETQRLVRLRKSEEGNKIEDHGGCVFVRLIGKYGWAN